MEYMLSEAVKALNVRTRYKAMMLMYCYGEISAQAIRANLDDNTTEDALNQQLRTLIKSKIIRKRVSFGLTRYKLSSNIVKRILSMDVEMISKIGDTIKKQLILVKKLTQETDKLNASVIKLNSQQE